MDSINFTPSTRRHRCDESHATPIDAARRRRRTQAAGGKNRDYEQEPSNRTRSPRDIPWYDYIGRKDPVTGEITCPWRKGRGKVQSGGSSGVQMAG